MAAPDPKTKRPRTKRILKRFPFWARPFLRWFLGRCAECPSRISCIERSLGGRGSLLRMIGSMDCREGKAGPVAKQVARFVRDHCVGCGSRPACAQYLGNHIYEVSSKDRERWPEAKARIEVMVDRCACCPRFGGCVQGAIHSCDGVPLILIRHLAIRFRCRLGLIEK